MLTVPFYLRAQSSAPPSVVTMPESGTKPDLSQEPAVFEYIHESMRYENDGSGTREIRSRIRVQSTAGLSIAGQLMFEYNAVDEQINVRSVRVLKKDGSIVTAGPEAVQDLSAPVTQEAPMYTDARQKHVTVPGVSVGDVVEYDVMINAKPILPGQFWRIWDFADGVIALDEQLDLSVPKSRVVKVKSSEGVEFSVSVEGDRRLYHWATSNLKRPPPIDVFKNFEFDAIRLLEGYRPPAAHRVMFSTFQSWTEVAEWYAQLERERRIPTPEIRAMADEVTRGQQTDEAKAQALYYWVSQNIRYVSLSFGVGRYQPHAAAEVLTNRYGDCKDKTTLLEAMLEAEGVHAHPALVSLLADIDPEMPNPMQFDHAIAFLRIGSKDTWLDTTLGVGPFGYLMPQLRNTEALVVSETPSTGLRKMPPDFPFTVEYQIGIEGKIDAQGILDANVELQTRGDLEVLIRVLNERVSKDQLARSADSILARTNRFLYGTLQYTDFKVANASEISAPVRAQFHANGKLMFLDAKSTPAQLTKSLTSGLMIQLHDLHLLPPVNTKPDSNGKLQQLSIELNGPRKYSLNLNLTFTDLTKSDLPPAKEFHLAQEFAEFLARDSWEGTTFHGYKSLDLRVPTIPVSDLDEYAAFGKKIDEAFAAPPDPKKESKPTSAPAKTQPVEGKHVAAPEVQAMYKRGEDESKRKNWANAIEAFGSATKEDPQYPEAWRELGRAYMYARQYSDAETAFRKYLGLAPNEHLAYLNMAWVLFNEKKYEEEKGLLLNRIAEAPDDGDALFRLGTAYLALHQPAQAVPVLERSTVQFPKYVAARLSLGRAYLETHQDLLAQESFRKVLALDDSESMLNSVAYLLAEHNSFLDLAEDWSQRSIDVVEKELNNSTVANLQSSTWTLVTKLSHYWDTMGWIRFQQGKTDAAEKYVLAAWQINDDLTIGLHLGRIYETLGRKDEAVEMYLGALNTIPPNEALSEDAKEIRKRLGDILGGNPQVDERLGESRKKKSPLRTVSIANPGGEQGIAQYTVIIDANSKVIELSTTNSDDPLAELNDAVRATSIPQSFPDKTLKKLPRLSTLACTGGNQPCIFTLLSAYTASRLAPLD
jgi:tetratricopeptide (TPR) repeat protein